jgi:dTMP kinase
MNKARYICFEGTEGVGKTTQTQLLVDALRDRGFSVLQTKEPGTSHLPLTMALRGMMLDNQYDKDLTMPAREYISQAIRSIHLEKLVIPAMSEYDFIVQDRGVLSGYAYGATCGNDIQHLRNLSNEIVRAANATTSAPVFPNLAEKIYDSVVYLKGDILKGLAVAKSSKQEYETGDAMESRGDDFMTQVSHNMDAMSEDFNIVKVNVDNKSIEEVHNEILISLGLGINNG